MSINIVQILLYSLIFIHRDEKLQNISNFNCFVCVWFKETQIPVHKRLHWQNGSKILPG